jgi:hypothetical protein
MKLVTVKLPDDLEQKLAELKGERSINAVICEALREQWFPLPSPKTHTGSGSVATVTAWPVFGSIPAEQRK